MVAEPVHHHPLLDCAEKLEAELAAVADVPAVYLPAVEKAVALRAFARVEAELTEARLRILAAAGDLAEASACRDAGIWLANETRTTRPAGRRDLELANAIDSKYLKVAGGMRAGAVNVDQARVIVAALDALPADLDTQVLARAEAELVALAGQFDPTELRRIGRKILEVVAPEVAEDEEAKALEREEQRARETCSFRFKPQGDGTTRIAGLIPDAEANRLETYLNAYTSPRVATGPVTPRHRLLGQAFCALLEHLDPKKLPDHGGDATTVIVTIDHTQLLSTLGAADLLGGLDGSRISATEARRLACTAHILPAVLGGKGEVLDLGRARRLFSAAQRKALRIRDRHCRAEGCSIPAPWCEAHHLKPWSQGGNTDLADGILLCNHHHHRAHDTRYETQRLASGDLRFHRRN